MSDKSAGMSAPTMAGHVTLPNGTDASWMLSLPPFSFFKGFELLANLFRDAFDNWQSPVIGIGSVISGCGDHEIERDVQASVASFGQQIGWLEEAVLEIAHRQEGAPGCAVQKLEKIHRRIEEVKEERRHRRRSR